MYFNVSFCGSQRHETCPQANQSVSCCWGKLLFISPTFSRRPRFRCHLNVIVSSSTLLLPVPTQQVHSHRPGCLTNLKTIVKQAMRQGELPEQEKHALYMTAPLLYVFAAEYWPHSAICTHMPTSCMNYGS